MTNLSIPDESYVSVDEANRYHALRSSFDSWNELSDEIKKRRLVSASDFLDVNYRFLGEKNSEEQYRQFPRKNTNEDIPIPIKLAVFELALQENLNQNEDQKMASVKVGPISVNYEQDSSQGNKSNRFSYVKSLLDSYLDKRNGFGSSLMLRG
ncbi:hypothetical protein A4G18_00445 [Pasteurellaceae bacterium Pebbles2]|nr:hypothetical protein [Pasteurellaceae bacterium Pebbles2]